MLAGELAASAIAGLLSLRIIPGSGFFFPFLFWAGAQGHLSGTMGSLAPPRSARSQSFSSSPLLRNKRHVGGGELAVTVLTTRGSPSGDHHFVGHHFESWKHHQRQQHQQLLPMLVQPICLKQFKRLVLDGLSYNSRCISKASSHTAGHMAGEHPGLERL